VTAASPMMKEEKTRNMLAPQSAEPQSEAPAPATEAAD